LVTHNPTWRLGPLAAVTNVQREGGTGSRAERNLRLSKWGRARHSSDLAAVTRHVHKQVAQTTVRQPSRTRLRARRRTVSVCAYVGLRLLATCIVKETGPWERSPTHVGEHGSNANSAPLSRSPRLHRCVLWHTIGRDNVRHKGSATRPADSFIHRIVHCAEHSHAACSCCTMAAVAAWRLLPSSLSADASLCCCRDVMHPNVEINLSPTSR